MIFPISRRDATSDAATFYDLAGKYAPVSIRAKVFVQDAWLIGGGWDDPLPDGKVEEWKEIRDDLEIAAGIETPRFSGYASDCRADLHAFCDASSRAYTASVYLRVTRPDGEVTSSLIIAKTKVAPIKTVSIPKLELCGALLLARLVSQVRDTLRIPQAEVVAWCDAKVALTWIQGHPSRWKPFVANRVSQIQTLLDIGCWKYVPSTENPADLATRGLAAADFAGSSLWFSGPGWLIQPECNWPPQGASYDPEAEEELRPSTRINLTLASVQCQPEWDLLKRYSSLDRLIRITAWLVIFNQKLKQRRSSLRPRGTSGALTSPAQNLKVADLRRGFLAIVRASQLFSLSFRL